MMTIIGSAVKERMSIPKHTMPQSRVSTSADSVCASSHGGLRPYHVKYWPIALAFQLNCCPQFGERMVEPLTVAAVESVRLHHVLFIMTCQQKHDVLTAMRNREGIAAHRHLVQDVAYS